MLTHMYYACGIDISPLNQSKPCLLRHFHFLFRAHVVLPSLPPSTSTQMDRQHQQSQHGTPRHALPPAMSASMNQACLSGDTATLATLVNLERVSMNSISINGWTPLLLCLLNRHLEAAIFLYSKGADFSSLNNQGFNALHCAAIGGDLSCLSWVLEMTSIPINSKTNTLQTPLMLALRGGHPNLSNFLVERGANLFSRDEGGTVALEMLVVGDPDNAPLGPRVLEHAIKYSKDARWQSVSPLLLLAEACRSPLHRQLSAPFSFDDDIKTFVARSNSGRLVASVLGNSDLARYIAIFLLRVDVIVVDPAAPPRLRAKAEEPDAVKLRIEARLTNSLVSTKI
jgi:hypothetical protein